MREAGGARPAREILQGALALTLLTAVTAVIAACVRACLPVLQANGLEGARRAREILQEMLAGPPKTQPNGIAYSSVLSACCRGEVLLRL